MKSVVHTRSFVMNYSIDALFPLFSPEGEKHWVPGWDYTNITGTTELSEDYVFLTSSHDHHMADAIWIVKAYDPDSHFVQFYKVEPGQKVGVVTVACSVLEDAVTNIQVTYKYTALSDSGQAFIAAFNDAAYDDFINEWEKLLSKYLAQND